MSNQIFDSPELETQFSDSDKESAMPEQGEELILGKFKNQDELIKAYRESEKLITKSREELKAAQRLSQFGDIPPGTYEFCGEIDRILSENNAEIMFDDVMDYFFENPELLALDNQTALSFAFKNLKGVNKMKSVNDATASGLNNDFRRNVNDYLNILPPELITGQGGELYTTPQKEPKTFEEAGEMFMNMLKK
jgi:hypothetical protein